MFLYTLCCYVFVFFFFKQKTAYEMRISDWSSDVCSSDLFEWFETGDYALKDVTQEARAAGLRYRRSQKPVGTSTIHYMLRNRLYAGAFEWGGRLYQGTHEPLVSRETWENVQEVLDGRRASNVRAEPLRFAFMEIGSASCREQVGQNG